jgi:5-(carboxyamino)imidazole ribonucleotide synthase
MVGLLAVDMFLTKDNDILVNEIAPRPHNSGHQTIEANITSQYEQHLRAICNMPLGDTTLVIPVVMVNILGEKGYTGSVKYNGLDDVLKIPGAYVHLYGKSETKPFRKMGHCTVVNVELELAKSNARKVLSTLKVIA